MYCTFGTAPASFGHLVLVHNNPQNQEFCIVSAFPNIKTIARIHLLWGKLRNFEISTKDFSHVNFKNSRGYVDDQIRTNAVIFRGMHISDVTGNSLFPVFFSFTGNSDHVGLFQECFYSIYTSKSD